MPCEFPSPKLLQFSQLCQFDYHQMPYLCDPSGIMSRTETELLDRQIHRLLHGKNVSGCICPSNSNQKYFPNIKIDYKNNFYNQKKLNIDACQIKTNLQKKLLNIAIILVPFSSFESINECIQKQQNFDKNYQQITNKNDNDLANATLRFTKELIKHWSDSSSKSFKKLNNNQILCKNIDIFIIYIQHWMPSNLHRPFVAQVHRHTLNHLEQYESVHEITENLSLFRTLLQEIKLAFKLIQGPNLNNNLKLLSNQKQYTTNINGVPNWAYVLVIILFGVVLITLYIGKFISKRLTLTIQQKKYAAMTNTRYNTNNPQNGTVNDRYKANFLINGNCNTNSGGNVGTSVNINNSAITSKHPNRITKSSIMFRQFTSGRNRSSKKASVVQKI